MKKLNFILAVFSVALILFSCEKLPDPKPDFGGNNGGSTDPTPIACVDKSRINLAATCPRVKEPVCGCNNVTYYNECDAIRHGVSKWRKGPCSTKPPVYDQCIDTTLIKPLATCPVNVKEDPVCGCDGKTYSSPCEARRAGVLKWRAGRCDTKPAPELCIDKNLIDPDVVCEKIFKPVCGCNGQTYPNPCVAKKHGVTRWKEGKCETTTLPCIDKSKIDPKRICPVNVRDASVCGCDGRTYPSPCEADKHGVTRWKEGPCAVRDSLNVKQ